MLPNMTQMDELAGCQTEVVGTGWVEWQTTNVPHIKTNGRYFKGKAPYSEKKIWLPAAGGVHTQKRVADQVASNDGCNGVYMTSIPEEQMALIICHLMVLRLQNLAVGVDFTISIVIMASVSASKEIGIIEMKIRKGSRKVAFFDGGCGMRNYEC